MENGWNKYEVHVLSELTRIERTMARQGEAQDAKLLDIDRKLTSLQTELAGLKGRASVWGTVAGFLSGGIITIVLRKMLGE